MKKKDQCTVRIRVILGVFCLLAFFSLVHGETSCIECHRKKGGHAAVKGIEPVLELWHSVHGGKLVGCRDCHGDDPWIESYNATGTAPESTDSNGPRKLDVTAVCGRCHKSLGTRFAAGSHNKKAALTCVLCHGKHAVKKTSPQFVSPTNCNRDCHDYKHNEDKIGQVKTYLLSAVHALRDSESVLRLMALKGIGSSPLEEKMGTVRKEYRELAAIVHTFDLESINRQSRVVLAAKEKVSAEAEAIVRSKRWRKWLKIIGIGLAFFLLVGILVFIKYKRRK
jgi:hypothetical protein